MAFHKEIKVAPDINFRVVQLHFREKLEYIDYEKRAFVIEKRQPIAGKYHSLIRLMIKFADEENIAHFAYKKKLTDRQINFLSSALFALLSYSGIIKGLNEGKLQDFFSTLEDYYAKFAGEKNLVENKLTDRS